MSQEPPAEQDAGAVRAHADSRASGAGAPTPTDRHSDPDSGSTRARAESTPPGAESTRLGAESTRLGADADARSPHSLPSRSRSLWPVLALVVALVALGASALAGLSWWQLRTRIAALESDAGQSRAALEAAVDDLRSSTADAVERSAALASALDTQREHVRTMADRLDPLPGRVDALERRVEADSGSSDARSEWLRAEAEYYLAVANAELSLGGRFETATAALELADDRLRSLADPSLTEVRRLVADELQQLKSITLPDTEGIALGLGSLAARVDELPLRRAGPGEADSPTSSAPLESAEPGLGRLWLAVKGALGSIVSVERTEQPVARALSADERVLVRRRLELELELARAAAVDAKPAAYAASLENALALLERDFDSSSAAVGAAVELLNRLRGVDIAPPRPDIAESLTRLRLVGRKD